MRFSLRPVLCADIVATSPLLGAPANCARPASHHCNHNSHYTAAGNAPSRCRRISRFANDAAGLSTCSTRISLCSNTPDRRWRWFRRSNSGINGGSFRSSRPSSQKRFPRSGKDSPLSLYRAADLPFGTADTTSPNALREVSAAGWRSRPVNSLCATEPNSKKP